MFPIAEAFYASLFSSIKCVLFYVLHKASELTSHSLPGLYTFVFCKGQRAVESRLQRFPRE